jgi:DUF4097 and DUF4098 domain-containing protein YvlB
VNAINKHLLHAIVILCAIVAVPFACGAETIGNGDRVVVPLSDPARPAFLKAHLVTGSITVKGGAANNIVVEARVREAEHEGAEGGMHRIPVNTTGLQVEEENNKVDVGADSTQRTIDLTITVPTRTSLSLHTVNDGDINVSNVDGELDVNDVNGSVTLKGVSGTVVAHALNGKVLVTLNRVNPSKPMAFSSLNGDIDVTFPPDLKANLVISSDQGEVLSDFDVALQARAPQQIKEDTRNSGGSYHVKIDKTVHGTINGGGQEIQFRNFNGNIYIRKAGAKG